ncbi:MAG: glutamine amidotransferase, partial [Loktanella sp.]|nr:glutamine amidotransferase [Loktanella sp.]
MCGIVGLFLKDKALEPQLGALLTNMLITMTDRGPDSAGIAIYGEGSPAQSRVTVQSETPDEDFATLAETIEAFVNAPVSLTRRDTHAVLSVPAGTAESIRTHLRSAVPSVRVMSFGDTLEIYKEVGLPRDVAARFDLASMAGTHG